MIQSTQAAVSPTDKARHGHGHAHRAGGGGAVRASERDAVLHLQRAVGNRGVASLMRSGTPTVQRGLFDMLGGLLGGGGSGLGGVASSLAGGNTSGALAGLQGVGAGAAAPLAQSGMGMLGNAIGGPAGGLVGGLGGAVGQGLTSVISGGSPAQAGMGVLGAAIPGLRQMAGSFLSRL